MNQSVELNSWRRDGKQLWELIQSEKFLVVWWNNPWLRVGIEGFIFLCAALALQLIWQATYLALFLGLICIPFLYDGVKYLVIGLRTGGLYFFFNEDGFGIGCDADRILIPYSQIEVPEAIAPSTVNQNYILLPVRRNPKGIMIEGKTGNDLSWDGKPYVRGIAKIEMRDGQLVACAKPNEMIVNLFCTIYPLSLHLKPISAEQGDQPDALGGEKL